MPDPDLRFRRIEGVNGLSMRVLEAGDPARPCILLLHGFPELAYSWRKVMPRLAAAGYYVVAPDQRGFGETTGWDPAALETFTFFNLAKDVAALLEKLGIASCHVAGHDFGSPLAGAFALLRPDLVRSVAFMSAPFGGAQPAVSRAGDDLHAALARLDPPRKHYQWYFSAPQANRDLMDCPQGLRAFLRAYFHMKSADWAHNRPFPLKAWSAAEMAQLPRYYVMDLDQTMPETVLPHMPSGPAEWLTDEELSVYETAYAKTTFQGGLNWYRCATGGLSAASIESVIGKPVEQPASFIAGAADWGIHQKPGELERMRDGACRDFRGAHFVEGAGHWVQQEQPERTADLLKRFLEPFS